MRSPRSASGPCPVWIATCTRSPWNMSSVWDTSQRHMAVAHGFRTAPAHRRTSRTEASPCRPACNGEADIIAVRRLEFQQIRVCVQRGAAPPGGRGTDLLWRLRRGSFRHPPRPHSPPRDTECLRDPEGLAMMGGARRCSGEACSRRGRGTGTSPGRRQRPGSRFP